MEQKLREYARLAIEVGLNLQKGQPLFLRTPVECAYFARMCAEAAYDAGCSEVIVDYSDVVLSRMKYLRADSAVFDVCPEWFSGKHNALAAQGAAMLTIYADDPDMLHGVDPDRIRRSHIASGTALKPYHDAVTGNKVRWCVVSAPIVPWATKVFPSLSPQEAMQALWDAIFQTLRITGDGKAAARWQAHREALSSRCGKLNALRLTELHYQNDLGTDLTIGLPEGVRWTGGSEVAQDGLPFVANMPTEEIFTAPHRERVRGRVVSSMPFVLNGNVIDRFALTFEKGRIVRVEAGSEAERAMLEASIHADAGSSYLGEVALVPFDSPISNLGILFYNTLFDENASCHLAFGAAYPCVEGGESMTREELDARGINDSITHQDFMIGTRDLSIVGKTEDGRTVTIFKNGNFAL